MSARPGRCSLRRDNSAVPGPENSQSVRSLGASLRLHHAAVVPSHHWGYSMDMNQVIDLTTFKLVASIVSLPLVTLGTWIKFRSSHLSLSQRRTRRLDKIMKRSGWRDVSSGTLERAVKEAFGVSMRGDMIRLALERDQPLLMLQTMKEARPLVKLSDDGSTLEDARKDPKLSFQTEANILFSCILAAYVLFAVTAMIAGPAHSALVAMIFGCELVIVPVALVLALRDQAAHRLLRETCFPRPTPNDRKAGPTNPSHMSVVRSSKMPTQFNDHPREGDDVGQA